MLSFSKRLSTGFTLIELLVVLGILGILAVALLATINPIAQFQKSNDAHRKTDLEQVQHALELYYQDNGKYPTNSGSYQIVAGSAKPWGAAWQPYIAKLPSDPTAGQKYIYYSPAAANGQSYYLYAHLERGKYDPQVCNSGLACTSMSTSGFPGGNSCGGTCNYGVSSTNVSP